MSSLNKETFSESPEEKSYSLLSDAQKVRIFTNEAGQNTPDKPQLMSLSEVKFISKMILDELLELYSTVLPSNKAKETMITQLKNAKNLNKLNSNNKLLLISEQADSFVDIWYYSLNCMAKKGINLSKIFNIVHNANMNKRDPKTKKFIKREDGKIIKPQGWKPPNILKEIKKQINNGSWN